MKTIRSLGVLLVMFQITAADTLYVSTYLDGTIHRIQPDGSRTAVVQGIERPYGVALNSQGDLFLCADSTNRIHRRTAGGVMVSFSTPAYRDGYTAMAFDANGTLFVGNQNYGAIVRFPRFGNSSLVTAKTPFPFGLAFDAAGTLHVAHTGPNGSLGYVSTVDKNGVVTRLHSGFISPAGLAFDGEGNLYVADQGPGTVVRFDPAGNKSIVATGLAMPTGIAFASDGSLLVVEQAARAVTRIATDGARSTVASDLATPLYIAVRNDTPPALALERTAGPDSSEWIPKLRIRGAMLGYQDVQASTDLVTWESIGTVQVRGADTVEFADPGAAGRRVRFYRTQPLW